MDGARSSRRGSSLHLQRWMTQLPEAEELDPPDPDMETWSVEELRKRSRELNLLEVVDLIASHNENKATSSNEKKENEMSPSKSSNSGSQITVRTSPVVVDTIPICRQCHKKCLSKPNSPLTSQKEPVVSKKQKQETSPSPQNSNSNKSSTSACSANCSNRKPRNFSHLERKGAMRLRPEDAPKAAAKVIDSIEQSQRMLKSTSYELKTDSPILSRSSPSTSNTKSQLELRNNSIRSPSPSSNSRNNSPFSTSHTTCSSMVFNSSSNDLRMSNSNIANQVQCVIAQEKYLNEVKCAESIVLSKTKTSTTNYPSPTSLRKEQTRQKAENVLNKVLGYNVVTKRESVGKCSKTSAIFLEDISTTEDDTDSKMHRGMKRSPRMGISAVSKMNGDMSKQIHKADTNANLNANGMGSDEDSEFGPLMLMGLSAINPASHLMKVEPFKRTTTNFNYLNSRPCSLESKSESPIPKIAIVTATPDFNSTNKTDNVDDSPDSPDAPEELPYISLKRYGTMSSLERLPSDETDDGNVRLTHDTETVKPYAATPATGGIMGWTARAGSFVVEKMNIFSYTESTPNTSQVITKQPTFLERYLGVSDWKSALGTEEGTGETGEGSGASGEEAWGTPSSGDLSDNLGDSEHGTLSSPTKSSSSYAGDDDTDLMMDELLMAPTITGPTTLRPLLPRRRLEPLLEEECSDSGSEENKPTPTNDDQGSTRGGADVCCGAPPRPRSVSEPETGRGGAGGAAVRGGCAGGAGLSPDRTPTNEVPYMPSPFVSKECAEARAAVSVAGARPGSASSASTPSTLERTTIHNPTPLHHSPASEQVPVDEDTTTEAPKPPTPERLSPRAEMRLALDQGKDMLADQEVSWGGGSDPWSFRAACQRQLLRRVASADAVTVCRAPPHRTVPHTTSRSSVYAWKLPENEEKSMEMEQLARAEVQTMRSRTRSQCQNGKILGFLRRRASSDSPRREPLLLGSVTSIGQPRPFSPRRTTVSNNGYYKICFVNGNV